MLNVKYFLQSGNVIPNPEALGNVWLAREIKKEATPNDELIALGKVYKLKNLGTGKLLVNEEEAKEAKLFGNQTSAYLMGQDTVPMNINRQMQEGMAAYFVMDENGRKDFIPKQMVDADSTGSFTKLAMVEVVNNFDPARQTIVPSSEEAVKDKYSGIGSIEMVEYLPNKMSYKFSSSEDQLAVFSEIYYPNGWTAKIDNKEVDILKVNYLLRGLLVEKGEHNIVFEFNLPKLQTANTMSISGTILLLLAFGAYGFMERKKRKEAA